MKKKYVVDLSEAEREELSGLVTRKNVAAKKIATSDPTSANFFRDVGAKIGEILIYFS